MFVNVNNHLFLALDHKIERTILWAQWVDLDEYVYHNVTKWKHGHFQHFETICPNKLFISMFPRNESRLLVIFCSVRIWIPYIFSLKYCYLGSGRGLKSGRPSRDHKDPMCQKIVFLFIRHPKWETHRGCSFLCYESRMNLGFGNGQQFVWAVGALGLWGGVGTDLVLVLVCLPASAGRGASIKGSKYLLCHCCADSHSSMSLGFLNLTSIRHRIPLWKWMFV